MINQCNYFQLIWILNSDLVLKSNLQLFGGKMKIWQPRQTKINNFGFTFLLFEQNHRKRQTFRKSFEDNSLTLNDIIIRLTLNRFRETIFLALFFPFEVCNL